MILQSKCLSLLQSDHILLIQTEQGLGVKVSALAPVLWPKAFLPLNKIMVI